MKAGAVQCCFGDARCVRRARTRVMRPTWPTSISPRSANWRHQLSSQPSSTLLSGRITGVDLSGANLTDANLTNVIGYP
jgi:uncharacterized protein YjbI with pentapeptide repeats